MPEIEVASESFQSDFSLQVKTEEMFLIVLRLRLTLTVFKDLFRTAQYVNTPPLGYVSCHLVLCRGITAV